MHGEGLKAKGIAVERGHVAPLQRMVEIGQDLPIHRVARRIIDGVVEGVVGLAPGPAGIDLDQQQVAEPRYLRPLLW